MTFFFLSPHLHSRTGSHVAIHPQKTRNEFLLLVLLSKMSPEKIFSVLTVKNRTSIMIMPIASMLEGSSFSQAIKKNRFHDLHLVARGWFPHVSSSDVFSKHKHIEHREISCCLATCSLCSCEWWEMRFLFSWENWQLVCSIYNNHNKYIYIYT